MMTLLALALAVTAIDDPVPGSPLYIPKLGEAAVLHEYDPDAKRIEFEIKVWTNTTALAKYFEAFFSPSNQHERTRFLGDPDARVDFDAALRERLLKGARDRGEVVIASDMTPVKVRVLAAFFEPNPTLPEPYPAPDYALVEVTGGPLKGRFFWAPLYAVRVPGARAPAYEGDFPVPSKSANDPPEQEPEKKPTAARPRKRRYRSQEAARQQADAMLGQMVQQAATAESMRQQEIYRSMTPGPVNSTGVSHYCGAPTLSGAPCRRLVIGPGYCYQHR